MPDASVQVVAHRGHSAVTPENTLPAFASAVRAGATFVEFDVRTTADGVPIVIHDRTVDRTTDGCGAVAALTAAEVRGLDAGSWFGPGFAGEPVPLLEEVLDLLHPAAATLLLEIKPPAGAAQVTSVVTLLAERELLGRTVVQSFDPGILRHAAALAPTLRRGLLRSGFDADPVATATDLGLTFYNPSVADVLGAPTATPRLRRAGVGVMPWTANDPDAWPALVEAGVAGLITDHAAALATWCATATPAPQPVDHEVVVSRSGCR